MSCIYTSSILYWRYRHIHEQSTNVGERYEHTILFFQILPVEKSRKPQASHLQTRVEYLLKLVQSEAREHARKKVHSLVTVAYLVYTYYWLVWESLCGFPANF